MSVEREIWVWARRSSVTAITTWPGLTWPSAARSTSTTIAATTPTANTTQPRPSQAALMSAARTLRRRTRSASAAWRAARASVIPYVRSSRASLGARGQAEQLIEEASVRGERVVGALLDGAGGAIGQRGGERQQRHDQHRRIDRRQQHDDAERRAPPAR